MELVPLIVNPACIETSGRNQLLQLFSERGFVTKHWCIWTIYIYEWNWTVQSWLSATTVESKRSSQRVDLVIRLWFLIIARSWYKSSPLYLSILSEQSFEPFDKRMHLKIPELFSDFRFLTWKLSMIFLCTASGRNKNIFLASRSSGCEVFCVNASHSANLVSFSSSMFPPMAYLAPPLYP